MKYGNTLYGMLALVAFQTVSNTNIRHANWRTIYLPVSKGDVFWQRADVMRFLLILRLMQKTRWVLSNRQVA